MTVVTWHACMPASYVNTALYRVNTHGCSLWLPFRFRKHIHITLTPELSGS